MDIAKINTFMSLCKFLNVSRAADNLGVAQPALSKFIANLEQELGVKLFYRLPRGLRLTPEGEIVLKYFYRISKELGDLQTQIKSLKTAPAGKFQISLHTVIARKILPQLEKNMTEQQTGLELDYIFQSSREGTQSVLNGEADFALVADARNYPDLVKIKLWSDFMGLFSFDGKLKDTVVYNPQTINANKILSKLKCSHYRSIGDYETISLIIKNTHVMGLLPSSVLSLGEGLKMVKKLYTTDISLIFRSDSNRSLGFKTTIDLIKSISSNIKLHQ